MIAKLVCRKSNKGSGFGSAIDVVVYLNLQFPLRAFLFHRRKILDGNPLRLAQQRLSFARKCDFSDCKELI
jgi:hypothetical protein